MLQAYVDGSGTGDPDRLVLAGYIADREEWAKFSVEWKARLDHARLPCFKMSRIALTPEIAGYFHKTLDEFDVKAAIACVVNTRELVDVETSIIYPAYIKNPNQARNPYYWAVKYIVGSVAKYQERLRINEPVEFVFDDETEKEKIIPLWEPLKAAASPEIKRLMGDTPVYRRDEVAMPLQAADLLAWWILKWEREKEPDWASRFPFPWGEDKKRQRIATYFGRKSFLADISDFLRNLAQTREELEYANSLFPLEWR